jgi:fatty acid desaturase
VNYHLEHHLYPSVPYHALPELRRALAADYRTHQSNVENGYGRTALVLLRDPHHFASKQSNR